MKIFWNRVKLILKEGLNIITNMLTPVISIVCVVMEICGVSKEIVAIVKQVEYWFFKVGATKPILESMIEKIDKNLNKESDVNANS